MESAALYSGMEVILVVMATQLDLRDNTTCYLYMKKDTVKIYSIDVQIFSMNSPLGKLIRIKTNKGYIEQRLYLNKVRLKDIWQSYIFQKSNCKHIRLNKGHTGPWSAQIIYSVIINKQAVYIAPPAPPGRWWRYVNSNPYVNGMGKVEH